MKKMVNIRKYLRKIDRTSAWILWFLLLTYVITGWSMTGRLKIVPAGFAQQWHVTLSILVFIFLLIHPGIQIYYKLGRWKKALRRFFTKG